jgi:hypothetical protein
MSNKQKYRTMIVVDILIKKLQTTQSIVFEMGCFFFLQQTFQAQQSTSIMLLLNTLLLTLLTVATASVVITHPDGTTSYVAGKNLGVTWTYTNDQFGGVANVSLWQVGSPDQFLSSTPAYTATQAARVAVSCFFRIYSFTFFHKLCVILFVVYKRCNRSRTMRLVEDSM